MRKSLSIIMIFLPIVTFAQQSGLLVNFDDQSLAGWEVPPDQPYTFELSASDSALLISYHRVAESWEWDNFNYTPSVVVDLSTKPLISLRAKSTVQTVLTLKPVYQNDTSDWLQVTLPADEQWHRYVFGCENAGAAPMYRIYFYLDGGSVIPAAGSVWLNDIRMGDSVRVNHPLQLLDLEIAIQKAEALLAHSEAGYDEGQFAPDVFSVLEIALQQAKAIFADENITQADVDAAVWDVYDACVTFESMAHTKEVPIIDSRATKETRYLFDNLQRLMPDYMLFGSQDPTGYGVGWSGDDDRSDIRDVCGSYPAIYGWGIRNIANGKKDERHRYRITSAFARGGINTISWHQIDPEGRGFYASDVNNERIVATLLPGGEYHAFYKQKLYNLARYFKSLRGANGQSIPIIFRPYHENNGSWFWWGNNHCTRDEFIQLWQFTVHYLRDSLNVHNLLYAYSPDNFDNKSEYLDRYPGDDYVDIIGHDWYSRGSITGGQLDDLLQDIRDIVEIAAERQKISALTETGREALDVIDWFTRVLLNPIKNDSIARNVAYAAVWRNANVTHHYAPYPGHPSVPDFLEFFDDPFTMFESDLPDMYQVAPVDSTPPAITKLPIAGFLAVDTLVTVEVITNERAYLRYSTVDEPYETMPFAFEQGQGITRHVTTFIGKQGEESRYYIRAKDLAGNRMDTSAVLSFFVDTTQAPIEWYALKYEDNNWQQGGAPLGFGAENIGTELNTVHTAYFRHAFEVDNAADISYCAAIVNYDNGVVVYLNGVEIGRINMQYGPVDYATDASSDAYSIKAIAFSEDQLTLLRSGRNVMAVELHQYSSDDADLFFDLRLITPAPLIEYGATWRYYDDGKEPVTQRRTVVDEPAHTVRPAVPRLYLNYPNPFNPRTLIRYTLPRPAHVTLCVYNVRARRVATLVNQRQQAGDYRQIFNAAELSSGLYLYQLRVNNTTITRKMLLVR